MELQAIAQQVQDRIKAETVIVALAQNDGKTVYYADGVGKHAPAIVGKQGDAATSGLCGVAFSGRDPVLVCETIGDPRIRQDYAIALQITTALAVPLHADDQLLGAIMALNRLDGGLFDGDDEDQLRDYAAIAALHLTRHLAQESD